MRPAIGYEEYIFERVVRLVRGFDDKERLIDLAETGVYETAGSADADRWFLRGEPPDTTQGVYECKVLEGDLADWRSDANKREVQDKVFSILKTEIERINREPPYSHAYEAAELLEELYDEIVELRNRLREFEGKPLYEGDCRYLGDASP